MSLTVAYVVFIIFVALAFDFSNGMNDAANSIATVVATRVLTPRLAVLWAAFFNFVAAFCFETHVANTIGKGLVDPGIVEPNLILATLLAAVTWTLWCTKHGLPISVSHALIGALAGAAMVKGALVALAHVPPDVGLVGSVGPLFRGALDALRWGKIGSIAMFIILSPLIGVALAFSLKVATLWICRASHPRKVDGVFRVLQLASAAVYSLSHGLNDAQKTMGIIVALLVSVPSLAGYAWHHGDAASGHLAWWIILSCHAAIGLGTYAGGWKVIETLGHKVTKLQPMGGFCAETGGGVTILALSAFGIPVSTTHTITGAIFGVGMTHRLSAVRWSVGYTIVLAWVFTLPSSAVMASVAFLVIDRISKWVH